MISGKPAPPVLASGRLIEYDRNPRTKKMHRFTIVLIVFGLCAMLCTVSCSMSSDSSTAEGLLPMPGFAEGWRSEGGVRLFQRDNLFEHINGEAELYFPYGFVQAATTTYDRAGNAGGSVSTDVYEMGSLLDAFGIYSNYRHPDRAAPDFGSDGFCDAYQLMFYQDKYFVRINALGSWEQSKEALLACGRAIAQRLPQPARQPSELNMLKIDGVEPLTEVYLAESVLGYAFFQRGFLADATINGQSVRVFIIFADTDGAIQKYTDFLKENDVEPQWITTPSGQSMIVQDPLHKGTILHKAGTFILGVTGLTDPAEGLPLIEQMRSNIIR